MNTPPSQKEQNKTVIKANHRNYKRADTDADRNSQPNNQSMSSHPFHNISNQLYKGQNTRSTCLKRVKIESCRKRGENEHRFHHLEKLDLLANEEEKAKKQYPKYRNKSTETKQHSLKSFIIRKKNVSNYSKKQQSDHSKCQVELKDMHQQVMLEIISNSKELDRKGYCQKSFKNIQLQASSTQPRGAKPKSVHILQSNFNKGSNTIKMKVIPCKQLKKTTKYFRGEAANREFKRIPSIQKKTDNQQSAGNENQAKKVQIISNSSFEHESGSKLSPRKHDTNYQLPKQKPKSVHSKQIGNKIERNAVRGGCKTIRVPWQASLGSINQRKQSVKKCQVKIRNQWQDNKIEDQMFGCISIIPMKQSKKKLQQTINGPPQSLKEIFLQLNENKLHESSFIKTKELLT